MPPSAVIAGETAHFLGQATEHASYVAIQLGGREHDEGVRFRDDLSDLG
jgi:hypothetical protein